MSPYRKACDKAREAASALGHDLAQRWEVDAGNVGRIRCTRCNASVVVYFYAPVRSIGAAIEEPCKEGNVKPEPERPEVPPTHGAQAELAACLASAEERLGAPIVFAEPERVPASFGRRK